MACLGEELKHRCDTLPVYPNLRTSQIGALLGHMLMYFVQGGTQAARLSSVMDSGWGREKESAPGGLLIRHDLRAVRVRQHAARQQRPRSAVHAR